MIKVLRLDTHLHCDRCKSLLQAHSFEPNIVWQPELGDPTYKSPGQYICTDCRLSLEVEWLQKTSHTPEELLAAVNYEWTYKSEARDYRRLLAGDVRQTYKDLRTWI